MVLMWFSVEKRSTFQAAKQWKQIAEQGSFPTGLVETIHLEKNTQFQNIRF